MVVVDAAAVLVNRAKVGRRVLTLLASVLYGLGWAAARSIALTVATARWTASYVALGWHEARHPRVR